MLPFHYIYIFTFPSLDTLNSLYYNHILKSLFLILEYELTPYEILMDDIRSRRYKLNKVRLFIHDPSFHISSGAEPDPVP
jgi:hypothetical protein